MGKQSRSKGSRRELAVEEASLAAERQRARELLRSFLFEAEIPRSVYPQIQDWFSAAFELTAATCLASLNSDSDLSSMTSQIHRIMDRFEQVATRIFASTSDAIPACRAGCAWCCHLRVTIKPGEALVLRDAVMALPAEQRERIVSRLAERAAELETLAPEARERLVKLCPLNENGACTVYAARPLVCRSAHSFDVNVCRTYVERGTVLPSRINGVRSELTRAIVLGAEAAFLHQKLDLPTGDLAISLHQTLSAA